MILFNILLAIAMWNILMSIINKQQTNKLFCGLVGYSGKTPFNKDKITQLLLMNSYERGEDAAGYYSPKNGLKKDAKHLKTFLIENPIEEDTLLIAHVRAKTIGLNNAKNAHPFEEGNVILAHNGTLVNHYSLTTKYNLGFNKYDVDSHVMCAIIAQEKNFKVLSEIDGGAAVIIANKTNPDIIYVYRNDKRPLFKGNLDGNMYISSIEDSLEFIGCKNIKEFKEHCIYTIKNGLIIGIPVKVASKPYTTTNTSIRRVGTYPELYGTYVQCDNRYSENVFSFKITFGWKYLVKGFNLKNRDLLVTDDNGDDHYIGVHMFNVRDHWYSESDYVKANGDLRKPSHKNNVEPDIRKDDILLVTKDKYDGNVSALHLTTNETFVIKKCFLTKLNKEEMALHVTADLNCETVLDFPPESFDHAKMGDEQNEYHEDDIDVEDEEDYDLNVDSTSLLSDFMKIDELQQKLFKTVIDFVPNEHLESVKDIKDELDTKLMSCADSYSITENAK